MRQIKVVSLVAVLLLILMIGASAAPMPAEVSITWDGYYELVYVDEPPDWHSFVDIEVRDTNGGILASQVILANCVPSFGEPGTGQCGDLVDWTWESNDFTGEVEEWIRLRWSAEGETDIYGLLDPPTEQDGRGFWLYRTFTGTGEYRIYLPMFFRSAE